MRNFTLEHGMTNTNPTPSEIAHYLIDNRGNSIADRSDYTIVILGRPGPTGKTWLCNILTQHGFNAVEISAELTHIIGWGAAIDPSVIDVNRNYCLVDLEDKHIVVVLNKELVRTEEE